MSRYGFLYFISTILIITAACSCGVDGSDRSHSLYGFYLTPAETITALDMKGKELSSLDHYILANAFRDNKNLKKAILHYSNCAFSYNRNLSLRLFPSPVYSYITGWHIKSEYYEDAVYQLAVIFYNYSEYEYAAKFASLVDTSDLSLYREAVIIRSRALEQMKKYDIALNVLKSSLDDFDKVELTPIIHIRIASVYAKTKQYENALEEFNKALSITTEGWQGSTAAKESYIIIKEKGVKPPNDPSLIAMGLISAKEYDKSIEIASLVKQPTIMTRLALVSAYIGKGKLTEADKIISRSNASSSERIQLLSVKADTLWEAGRRTDAVRTIKELIHIPQINNRLLFRRLCYYLYENNSAETAAYCSLYTEKYPSDGYSDQMLWLAAKPYIERHDFNNARLFLARLIDRYPEGEYSGNARFWLYKILTAEKKKDDAELMFRTMAAFSPGSAYTWSLMNRKKDEYSIRSLEIMYDRGIKSHDRVNTHFAHAMLFIKTGDNNERLDRMKEITKAGMNPWKVYNNTIEKFSFISEYRDALRVMEKYYAAGDTESIQRIFNVIIVSNEEETVKNEIERDKALAISGYGYKYGNYYQQISGSSSLLGFMNLQENLFLMSNEGIERIIPQGFKNLVLASSKESGIRTNLLFSVIKTESAFNSRAVSGAGASGLMQLMPPTAKEIAKKLKVQSFDMKRPADSIRFGAHYLVWLNSFFKGNYREVIAGYNAGPGNVLAWKKKYDSSDIDFFTEQVPFDETRKYMLFIDKFSIQYGLFLR
jgi:hypothetical protein